jgi:hypothetical protein
MEQISTMAATVKARRLGGEPDDATTLDDINLWVGVYAELTSIVRRLAVASQDLALLERAAELEERQNFWNRRRAEELTKRPPV